MSAKSLCIDIRLGKQRETVKVPVSSEPPTLNDYKRLINAAFGREPTTLGYRIRDGKRWQVVSVYYDPKEYIEPRQPSRG